MVAGKTKLSQMNMFLTKAAAIFYKHRGNPARLLTYYSSYIWW